MHGAKDTDWHWSVVGGHCSFYSIGSVHSHYHTASGLLPLQDVLFKGELASGSYPGQKEGHYLLGLSGGGLDYYILHLHQNHAYCQRSESRCKESQKHVVPPWFSGDAFNGLVFGPPGEIHFAEVVPYEPGRPSIRFLCFLSDNPTILDTDPVRFKRQQVQEALKRFLLPQSSESINIMKEPII